jgi:GT2 family glycosyltransferase
MGGGQVNPIVARNVAVELPAGAPGCWCLVQARAKGTRWWAQLQLEDSARGQVVRQVFLGPRHGRTRKTLVHVPAEAGALTLLFIAEAAVLDEVRVRVLSRAGAALRLLLGGWRWLPVALRGDRLGVPGRVRAILGQAPARGGEAPPYEVWLALYEERPGPEGEAPAGLQVAVVRGDAAATQATLDSAPAGTLVIGEAADWNRLGAEFVVLLGAGEILAPHALARFAAAIAEAPRADVFCADADEIDAGGRRHNPLFKPEPGPVFLESGLLTAGACAFRRGAGWDLLPLDADAARLLLARRSAPAAMRRIPAILSHLRASPVARQVLAAPALMQASPRVSIIIPSSCRSAHVLRCLRAVAASVADAHVEILLTVSTVDAHDRQQAACLARAGTMAGVRVLDLDLPGFNYAEANNRAAAQARGEFLLLLNDDVLPVTKDFLPRMMSHAATPCVGAVGARLLYGNDTVQHAGVILGLAGLCEHAGRLADASDQGDHGRACVDREVSAVTAACMLLRAGLFAELGGFDTAFAVALNDVDLCLRILATGAWIVYTATATLYHYESMTLGRHYRGVRAALEVPEVRRLRGRWAAAIACDPYYNPQASLEPGREWQPAFPPRVCR